LVADLPAPVRERFQPLRAGILNIWQYDDQELRFEDGRLILRGENGSGKSKALEVLLPFLYDADLSPQRLDPFGGTSRTMEWNLLQEGRFESRVGYVWLELGRLGEEGEEVCWTLGCGLRANQRTRRVDAWYFLTRLRVGRDLALLSAQRTPLLKDQLRQEIGEAGWVFDTGRDYREKLGAQVFGLNEDRFATLRHLLLQLRRPHLSERLDPHTLSEILKESLPSLDPDLIGQLSEIFERLDNEQKELGRVEAAVASVASFLEVYREYVRGMARARSADVRGTDSRYHKTAAEVREADEEGVRLDGRLGDLAERESGLEDEISTVRGTIQGLEKSDLMRSAEVLRTLGEHAETLAQRAVQEQEDASREERVREERGRDFAREEAEAGRVAAEREAAAGEALAAARQAGLEPAVTAALAVLSERAAAAEATVRAAVRLRREGIDDLQRLVRERDQARQKEERSEERLREADARLRQAVARGFAARAEVERRRQLLEEALVDWGAGLEELRLDEAGLQPLRDHIAAIAAIAAGEGDGLAAVVAALAIPRREALVREQTALEEEVARTAAEERALEDERRRVEAARELGPEPPRTRAADRTGRPGAPLYLLCELAEELDAAERAGLEAALEASGLLDAWVLPDGGLLAPGTLDTFLVPGAPAGTGTSLAALLRPAPGHGVELPVIDAILRSIEISGVSSSIGKDGTFHLGPLRGAWSKPVAEHLGAGAREAARARRLAEIAAALQGLAQRLEELAARGARLEARLACLDREAAAVPSAAPLVKAAHQAEAAVDDEIRRRAEREAAEDAEAAARTARLAAEQRLTTRARDLGLEGQADDLEDARDRLRDCENGFGELVRATAAAAAAIERSERARQLLSEAVSRAAELRQRAQASGAEAQTARAEHAALEATVGVEARDVVERHREEQRRLGELEHRRRRLGEEVQAAREQRAGARERLRLRQIELTERESERAGAVARLGRLVDAGLLPLVLGGDPEPPPAWSLTRALELAREIERTTDEDLSQEAANRRVNRLHERFRLLAADLGAEYQPSLDQEDDLARAWVGYNGHQHDVSGLLATLRENLEVRRGLLAEHERESLRRYLLGDVGDHLRQRLRQARALVDEMNRLLESCRTASGMTLKLAWEPLSESAPEIREAVQLLRQDLALLADDDRRRLEAFFQGRIAEARQHWEAVPWREHLMAALDYRAWHRFRILRRAGDERDWSELTRRGHGASSGGEKAVALHLPLFAAAAAHYRSAKDTAPRIILLDEAFAGIDQRMRGRCMGLLVDLDLDFLMTSHEEWGCYEELPGVATYQLYRDPTLDGVAAVRFVWSGRQLREMPE
jgi:uncharacterized protein (TIGR02680 family)